LDNATHRDPEIIRREIMIADLSASNCALQADGIYKQIEALQMKAEGLKAPHDQHVARKAALEEELTEALKLPPLVL
jgi:hypothetical protein